LVDKAVENVDNFCGYPHLSTGSIRTNGQKQPPAVAGGYVYFNRFSRVAAFRAVRYTRSNPYSEVRTKDLGRSSQGTTSPSSSLFSRNSRVRLEVEVLSRSKIPTM